MKKLMSAVAGLALMAFASAPAQAGHEASTVCHPIEQAKIDVASWDTENTAVWEYAKEGYKYDALLAWVKARLTLPEQIDGILITYIKNPEDGAEKVLWAVSPDGKCVLMFTFNNMTKNEFENIVGKGA